MKRETAELERFRGSDAHRAWLAYLLARIEQLKERIIDAEDRDAVAYTIKFLREIRRETDAPPVRLPQSAERIDY